MHLSDTHPVRHLTKPFSYNTIGINFAATKALEPENGQLHRTSGLTYKGVQTAFKLGFQIWKYQSFPDWIATLGQNSTDTPMAEDGIPLWNIYREMVHEALSNYYGDDCEVFDGLAKQQAEKAKSLKAMEEAHKLLPNFYTTPKPCITSDVEMVNWWRALQHNHGDATGNKDTNFFYFGSEGGQPDLTIDSAADALTYFFFFVSAWHELVGTGAHAHDDHRMHVLFSLYDARL